MRQRSNFLWEAKFRRQKNGWEKKNTNWVSCLQKEYKKLRIVPSQYQRKDHKFRNKNIQQYASVKFPLKCAAKFHWIWTSTFKHSRRLRNNNNFYLNVTEWLASPGGTKFSKPIEEMSKEELNVFLKRFCTPSRKKDGTLSVYKSSSMKSIWEPPWSF